jgi:hypothetical protein
MITFSHIYVLETPLETYDECYESTIGEPENRVLVLGGDFSCNISASYVAFHVVSLVMRKS